MGTLVVSSNVATGKWLVVPSDGSTSLILNCYDDLIEQIELFVKTATITATPFLITDIVDGHEQSFSFCITWKGLNFAIAGPHWQRLVNKAFDGFCYDGISEDSFSASNAKEFTIRFATHLLVKGLRSEYPVRAGIDFFVAILPDGTSMLIAQDPNMRDTATSALPLVVLVNHGKKLLNGNLVLSQSDHTSIPAHKDCLTLVGVLQRLKSKGVPLVTAHCSTGVILESLPKLEEARDSHCRLLVGFVAPTKEERAVLEKTFSNAFSE